MKKQNLLFYLFSNKLLVWATVCLIVFAGLMAEATPFLQSLLLNQGIVKQDLLTFSGICIVIFFVLMIDMLTRVWLMFITNKTGFKVAHKIRSDFFKVLISQPYTFFKSNRSGDVVFRTNIFIFTVGDFLAKHLQELCVGIARFVVIFAYMFVLDVKFALVLAVVYLLAMILVCVHSFKTYKIGKKYKQMELHRNSLILQNLDNIETYLAYNDDFEYFKHYNRVNSAYRHVRGQFFFAKHMFYPIIDFVVSLGTVLIYQLTFSATLGAVEVGVVVAMLTYANRITSPLQLVGDALGDCVGASATISKIFEKNDFSFENKIAKFEATKVDIECKNLSYTDPNTSVGFKNVNLSIPFGSLVAITAGYGSGKTIFAELLMGLYHPQDGQVLLNGVDITTINEKYLRNTVSMASDDVGIFEGTIFENVRLAKPKASKKDVMDAIKRAGLLQKAEVFQHGVETKISASTLSEGDKQLVAFARVILKNTPIAIFDECVRDLEDAEKLKFYKNLMAYSKNKTIIYISQKLPSQIAFSKKIFFEKYHK